MLLVVRHVLDLVFLMVGIMGIVVVKAIASDLASSISFFFSDESSFCNLVAKSLASALAIHGSFIF